MRTIKKIDPEGWKQKLETRFPAEISFIKRLERLAGFADGEADRAALAHLRRTLGKHPDDAVEAYPYIAPQVELALRIKGLAPNSKEAEWYEHCCYLVAALFASYQTGEPRASWHHAAKLALEHGNFGASFLLLEQEQRNGESSQAGDASHERAKNLERRFTALLASRRADLPQRLRQCVSLLKPYDIPIDWVQLLADLQEWRGGEAAPYRIGAKPSVQRRWAKSFWGISAIATDAAFSDKPDEQEINQLQEDES